MRWGVTMKIFCTTQRFAGYLVAKCLRVVELKDELLIFLLQKDKCSKFADLFCDDKWLSEVCYLADMFKKINALNLSLQGKGDVLTMSEKVTAFQKKLMLWREHFENGCLEMFHGYVILLLKIM
ncbi:unnamed protein product [Caretta caretta]